MPPLVPALLAALALAAHAGAPDPLGRCAGQGVPDTPPAGGSPVDTRTLPGFAASKAYWLQAGYAVDERTGQLLAPDRGPVTDTMNAWMSQPVDLSRTHLTADEWTWMSLIGLRPDEQTCHLQDGSGAALTRLQYRAVQAENRRQFEHVALESLKAKLEFAAPGKPVPDAVVADLKAQAAIGKRLPESVQKLIDAGAPASEVYKKAEAAYADSTRYFDGRRSFSDLIEAALPPGKPGAGPHPNPSFVMKDEKSFDATMSKELQAQFGQTELGRKLLDHFRAPDGSLHMPPILLYKASQQPADPGGGVGAYFNPGSGALTLNHWEAVRIIEHALPEQKRADLGPALSDAGALRAYLMKHPDARQAIMGNVDEITYHELIHAWQDKRDAADIELMRGNIAMANPLVKEHEAHREQCRYMFTKALAEPMVWPRSGYADWCAPMLKDYDSFRDQVTRLYMQSFSGSGELPDVVARQREREVMSLKIMNRGGLGDALVQALKLIGMLHGDKALSDMQKDYAERERVFIHDVLPELRKSVGGTIPRRYIEAKRPDLALRLLHWLPSSVVSPKDAKDAAEGTKQLLAKPPKTLGVLERLTAYNVLPQPWPDDLWGGYYRDIAGWALELRAQGRRQTDPALRKQYADAAATYAKIITEGAPRSVAELREKASKLKDPAERKANLELAAKLARYLEAPRRALEANP